MDKKGEPLTRPDAALGGRKHTLDVPGERRSSPGLMCPTLGERSFDACAACAACTRQQRRGLVATVQDAGAPPLPYQTCRRVEGGCCAQALP